MGISHESFMEASGWVRTPADGVEVLAINRFKKRSIQETETRERSLTHSSKREGNTTF